MSLYDSFFFNVKFRVLQSNDGTIFNFLSNLSMLQIALLNLSRLINFISITVLLHYTSALIRDDWTALACY